MDSDSNNFSDNDEDILKATNHVTLNLLNDETRKRYTAAYNEFQKWRRARKTTSLSEEIFLTLFSELAQTLACSTLWTRFAMLKATVKAYDNIDIGTYNELTTFIKKLNIGHETKKPKAFTKLHIEKFCNEAPDDEFLATKVALLIGVSGACRCKELSLLRVNDVEDHNSFLFICLPEKRKRIERGFTVVGNCYEICKKYIRMRPDYYKTDRFFINFKNGKYTGHLIGINVFRGMPKEIATFLKLPNPEEFTRHTFRRTFRTLPVDFGADIATLKRNGTHKSYSRAKVSTKNPPLTKKSIEVQISQISKEKSVAIASTSTSASLQPAPKRLKSSSTHDELLTSSASCVKPATQLPSNISERIMKLKYPIIVVNTDRTERKTYMTHANIQEAIKKANKFSCPGKIIVHDEDGSEVCDDDILEYLLQRKAEFMICNVSSDWIPQNSPSVQTTKVIASSRKIFVPETNPSITNSIATEIDIIRNKAYPEFANFSIPWEKVPPYVMTLLETGEPLFQNASVLIRFLIDQLILIKQTVPVAVTRKVAAEVISRYPQSFLGFNMYKNKSEAIGILSYNLRGRYFTLKSKNARIKSVNNEKLELSDSPEHDTDIDIKIDFNSLSSNE